jgi:hypothetical protein
MFSHEIEGVEKEIENVLVEGKKLAEETLKKEKKLLLAIADFLSDNTLITKPELETLIKEHSTEKCISTFDGNFYRNLLKKEVQTLIAKELTQNYPISLNKSKK